MPQVGFKCPLDDSNRSFDYCIRECGARCLGGDIPLLLWCIPEQHEKKQNRFGVLEIIYPPQITLLRRRCDYYASPEDSFAPHLGKAWHESIEKQKKLLEKWGYQEDYILEEKFEVKIPLSNGTVTLVGVIDSYQKSTQIIRDYKLTKLYAFGKKFNTNTDWFWQLNIYKYFKHPEAKQLLLCGGIKDFTWRNFPQEQINQLHIKKAPQYTPQDIQNYTEEHLIYLKTCQDNNLNPRPCTKQERWGGIRCERYCGVSDICEQRQNELKGNEINERT